MAVKFPLPAFLQFANVPRRQSVSDTAGKIVRGGAGQASARVEGPDAAAFSVTALELLALQRDPDVLHSPLVWETVDSVNGSGPINLGDGSGLGVEVTFSCPAHPGKSAFAATAVVFDPAAPATGLLTIPISATVDPGHIGITGGGPFTMFTGTTKAFSFHLASTIETETGGIFTCDNPATPQFTSDTDPQFPTVPSDGSVDLVLPVTCAAATAPGTYQVQFRFRQLDDITHVFGVLNVEMIVMEGRDVTVSPSLSSPVTLARGNSTPCFFRVVASGGLASFSLAAASVPAGITLSGGAQTVGVDGSALLRVDVSIDARAPLGALPPLVFHWTVAGDPTHPEVSGDHVLNISVVANQYQFGFNSFHVDNCRSKGDHNDVDTLIVVVSNDHDKQPAQTILLGDNLHAGDPVANKFVGPFTIDHDKFVTVTFTVLNTAGGDTLQMAARVGSEVEAAIGTVLDGVALAEELHAFGLAASAMETAILGEAGTVFGLLGALVHIAVGNSNPDCSGAVLVRSFTFRPGELLTAPQTVGPVQESQRSPSECGNDPHSTVIFALRPL